MLQVEGGVDGISIVFATWFFEALKSGGSSDLSCVCCSLGTPPAKDGFLGSRSCKTLLVP